MNGTKKETLVDDLNAEIGEDEDEEEDAADIFDNLLNKDKTSAKDKARSRNSFTDKNSSSEEGVGLINKESALLKLSLEKDENDDEDEVRTVEIEE